MSSVLDYILWVIGILSLLLGFFWGVHKLFTVFIKPRTKKYKYKKLYTLIEDWFDEIDKNIESGLNNSLLNNKESKIRQFILDHKLENDKLRFTKKIRRQFLKFCGVSKKHWDDKILFSRYARCPHNYTFITIYIDSLIGAFYNFLGEYHIKNGKPNFAEINMRVKLLKMYFKIKR